MIPLRTGSSPLVSVVIPIHDRFDLAARAIASVVRQTHRPIEIIAVDDASKLPFEAAPGVSSRDLDLKVVRLASNLGPGAAREAGRVESRGTLIAYLDSDDYWEPDHLADAVAAFSENPGLGMAYCTVQEVRDGVPGRLRRRSSEDHAGILPTLLWGRPWHTSGCVWSRELSEAIGPWLPIWHWEDYEYDCRAGCLNAQLAHLPKATCLVQSDAPARQSEHAHARRRTESFGASVLSIAAHLRGTPWIDDDSVCERVRALLLSVAVRASEGNMPDLASRAIAEAWRWPRRQNRALVVASFAGMPLLWALGAGLSTRAFRWARASETSEKGIDHEASSEDLG